MKLQFYSEYIPGTRLKQADMDGATGLDFLKKVFFISDGVMLTQIRVRVGDQLVPVKKYRFGEHPSAQLGTLHEDNGRKLTDGVESTGPDSSMVLWDAKLGSRTLTVDLESVKKLHQISLHMLSFESKNIYEPADVHFSVSEDGINWFPPYLVNRCLFATNGEGDVVHSAHFPEGTCARYLKAEIVPQSGRCAISEITAY